MTDRAERVRSIDFADLPKRFDIAEAESRWREKWSGLQISKRDRSAPRGSSFIIDSPPPTVSGSLHVGHVFSYTHQDLLARFNRMTGRNVVYPMGWDDNGLPTERRVQNFFGVRIETDVPYIPNLDIEAEKKRQRLDTGQHLVISRENFIELCHRVTAEDEVVFKDVFNRMGFSIDWQDEYATIDDRSRRIAQRSFLDLFEKGEVYQLEAPTMWDVDFQTAVAQAEVEDREKSGAYHDIEFAVQEIDTPVKSFVISTTRPELLAACVGVAAHPDDPRFKPLFGKHAITPVFFASVPIFPSELADPEKGTGILMVCTFGDQTDVQWWRENNLQLRQVVGRDGRIVPRTYGTEGWESNRPEEANANYVELVGKRLPTARKLVVEMLRLEKNSATGDGVPLRSEPKNIVHPVRYYEKGDSPLEYLTTRQWFVRLLDKKDRLLEMGRRINWHPDFMRKRFENWTENLGVDWCISRQRYFGVPIPVWYRLDTDGDPQFDQVIVAEPGMLPVDPSITPPPGFNEEQRGEPGGFIGEADVFDTWFTSSLTPQIVARWGDDDQEMDRLFPMDVRPQAHDIIRTWAFYTIAKAALHQDDVPWHNTVISGWILDPDRKKMSKSRGNVVTPAHLIDQHGADAIRYWAASARLGADTAFDEALFKIGGKLVTKIFNAGKFVLVQAGPVGEPTRELDRAFLSDLGTVVDRATAAYEKFEYAQALDEIEQFFWNGFTDNYIELVKGRARKEDDPAGQASAIAGLRTGLSVLLRLFAPTLPTIADEVWSWAFAAETGADSIHQAPWPTRSLAPGHDLSGVGRPSNDRSFAAACDAIGAVRKAKAAAGIGLGKPLAECRITGSAAEIGLLDAVADDVAAASGASSIELVEGTTADGATYSADVVSAEPQ